MIYREYMTLPTKSWFMSRVRKRLDGCWEFMDVYGRRRLSRPTVKICRKQMWLSRWVFETYKRRELGHLFACHTCDRRWCVNPVHLWAGTARDNVHDAMEKGRWHILTSDEARRIVKIRGSSWNKGTPMDAATKRKLSKANRGQKRTPEQRINLMNSALKREKRFKKLGLQRRVNSRGHFTGGFYV